MITDDSKSSTPSSTGENNFAFLDKYEKDPNGGNKGLL